MNHPTPQPPAPRRLTPSLGQTLRALSGLLPVAAALLVALALQPAKAPAGDAAHPGGVHAPQGGGVERTSAPPPAERLASTAPRA
jgi:hypothetical protein